MKSNAVLYVADGNSGFTNSLHNAIAMYRDDGHLQLHLAEVAHSVQDLQSLWVKQAPNLLMVSWFIIRPIGQATHQPSLIAQVHKIWPASEILVYGMPVLADFDSDTDVLECALECVQAGAKGLLADTLNIDELLLNVRLILQGGAPISPGIARYLWPMLLPSLLLKQASKLHSFHDVHSSHALSKREHEVLGLVAKGFSQGEIAEMLAVSAHTVGTYIKRIYKKLEVHSRTHAVHRATQLGLISMGNDERTTAK